MPLHPVAIELLREAGPMAVSSANRSGQPPATTVDEAADQLGDSVSVYLDGGPCRRRACRRPIVDVHRRRSRVLLRAGADRRRRAAGRSSVDLELRVDRLTASVE